MAVLNELKEMFITSLKLIIHIRWSFINVFYVCCS